MNLGSNQRISGRSYLDGQCLIAMPGMSDQRFARSVVYLCAHSEDGAMGIIVNKPAADTHFPELLVQLDVIPSDQAIRLPSQAEKMKVLRGGPVETKRGFVLHSADFFLESATLPIDDGICLTATLDILRAIAVGTGPENAVLRLLTRIASRDDVRAFVDESVRYTEQDDRDNADAVYQVSVSANRALYEGLKRSDPEMCTALRELFKDELEAELNKATKEAENAGFARAIIGLVRDGTLTPEAGAQRMHISLDEMKKLAARR